MSPQTVRRFLSYTSFHAGAETRVFMTDDVIRARLRTVGVQEHIMIHERRKRPFLPFKSEINQMHLRGLQICSGIRLVSGGCMMSAALDLRYLRYLSFASMIVDVVYPRERLGFLTLSIVGFPCCLRRGVDLAEAMTVNAIIFLAPISAFNQVLDEDRDKNRLVRPSSLSTQVHYHSFSRLL